MVKSAVVPFEVREGMEGEHTPETDLTRWCQVFFVYTVEARMRANTQNVQQGEQETKGVGEGR